VSCLRTPLSAHFSFGAAFTRVDRTGSSLPRSSCMSVNAAPLLSPRPPCERRLLAVARQRPGVGHHALGRDAAHQPFWPSPVMILLTAVQLCLRSTTSDREFIFDPVNEKSASPRCAKHLLISMLFWGGLGTLDVDFAPPRPLLVLAPALF